MLRESAGGRIARQRTPSPPYGAQTSHETAEAVVTPADIYISAADICEITFFVS
jgi:hypothetical protein